MKNRLEELLARIEITAEGCWEWQGERMSAGHGRSYFNSARSLAHRAMWEEMVGPIPEGLVLDHLCRNPPCVNPEHLEPVTNAENVLRGVGAPTQNARKTHCKRGHPLEGDNLILRFDGRECRTCARMHQKASRARRAALKTRGGRVTDDPRVHYSELRERTEHPPQKLLDEAAAWGFGEGS